MKFSAVRFSVLDDITTGDCETFTQEHKMDTGVSCKSCIILRLDLLRWDGPETDRY